MSDVFLILHGWGGNKPAHWQEHLVKSLRAAGADVRYPIMPDPASPDLDAWLGVLRAELDLVAEDATLTVLAHSLGGILWMHHAASGQIHGPKADRVLLVAPPYVIKEIPPLDAPPSVSGFFPPPMSPESIARISQETIVVASDTDDYATFDQSSAYAGRLDVPIHKLPGGGHISPYYGYGEWPWALDWTLRKADFPPLPNS